MQIRGIFLAGAIAVIILVAFASGFGLGTSVQPSTSTYTITTFTDTTVTYIQLSGSDHSVFYVTEKVVVEPEVINEICIGRMTNTTVSTTYYLPSEQINGTSPIGIMTTSTTYLNYTTTTLYENATVIMDSTSRCTLINSHYNVTQTENKDCFCV